MRTKNRFLLSAGLVLSLAVASFTLWQLQPVERAKLSIAEHSAFGRAGHQFQLVEPAGVYSAGYCHQGSQ